MASARAFLIPSGYNFRAVLAFCRALRQWGHTPAVMACTSADPIFRTRFAKDVVFVRASQKLEISDFAAAVAAVMRSRPGVEGCLLAPASEFLVRWALQHRAALAAAGCFLPLPEESVYLQVTDKELMVTFCRQQGLRVPAELPGPDVLPCVAKPRRNVAADGRSLYPWLLRTPADRTRFLAEARCDDFFFQEWVEGRSFYLLFYLPEKGAAIRYSQENLAQQPAGKSILLARASDLHTTAEGARWESVLRTMGFFGLVMVELRQRGAEYFLIEANPRLWGPLQLCVDACPMLLRRYITDCLAWADTALVERPARRRATYVWSGGMVPGEPTVWHGAAPRFPRWALLRQLTADVYFRADSWRYFFYERGLRIPAVMSPEQAGGAGGSTH